MENTISIQLVALFKAWVEKANSSKLFTVIRTPRLSGSWNEELAIRHSSTLYDIYIRKHEISTFWGKDKSDYYILLLEKLENRKMIEQLISKETFNQLRTLFIEKKDNIIKQENDIQYKKDIDTLNTLYSEAITK